MRVVFCSVVRLVTEWCAGGVHLSESGRSSGGGSGRLGSEFGCCWCMCNRKWVQCER